MSGNEIELGELTLQYVAATEEASEELEELRQTIGKALADLDHADVASEEFAVEDFDIRLSWETEDGE